MSWIAEPGRGHPELAFFAALGLGHLLGRIRLGSFRIDPVIGVRLVFRMHPALLPGLCAGAGTALAASIVVALRAA